MCRFAAAFVPGKNETDLILPENETGLILHSQSTTQPDFSMKYNNKKGVVLGIDDGHCLCNFKDWPTFFRWMERIRQANNAAYISVLVFYHQVYSKEKQ